MTSLQQTQAAIGQAQYESALGILIDAVKELDAIASVTLAAQQVTIDRVMQEAGRRWYVALPPCPATPACR